MPEKLLKINDAGWLFAETFRTPMQVGVLANFSMPDDAGPSYLGDLVTHWRSFTTFEAPFNYKLKGSLLPRWEVLPDEAIDLDYHVRHSAVPSPGGERELGVLVSRLHSMNMDRRYPLWECHVIEGVAERCWSLYMKVHHSQIDGVGGIRLAKRMFTTDPEARGLKPPWAIGLAGEDQSGLPAKQREEAPDPGVRERITGGVRSVGSVAGALTRTYLETAVGSRDDLRAVPWRAPKSILNERISRPRRFATQAYSIERLRSVAKAAGGTLNDVFLALSGGALRRYLAELGELPEESLTAIIPVSVRAGDEPGVGNAISFLYARLGTDVDDAVDRIKAIHESTRLGKQRMPTAGAGAMDLYTVALMGPFLGQAMAGIGGHGRPAHNLVISNVPGMSEQRYVEGSQMREYYPLSLLFHGQALNITAVSNAETFCIGYTGCRETLPSLQKMAVYTGEALEELEEALGL